MSETLTANELGRLIRRVFQPTVADRGLAILVDLPDDKLPDNSDWKARRETAVQWHQALQQAEAELDLDRITLAWYPNVGGNNADLPAHCHPAVDATVLHRAGDADGLSQLTFAELFAEHSLVLAPTELSATAPLKVATRAGGFRAATMPGFLASMIPALRLDYELINRRVKQLAGLLDEATGARFQFRVGPDRYYLTLDLRHNPGHASGGLFPDNGVAGNLPSGEAYIVPYEGEIDGDPSRSAGTMPVQLDGEVVLYRIAENKAVEVLSSGPVSEREAAYIKAEPAYANLSELGLGVLGDFGLKPTGTILLDEKLGLHIAFGRSDHFGGQVGPDDFSSPDAVVHIDRVYIPEVQPDVEVVTMTFAMPDGPRVVMRDGAWDGVF